MMKHTEKFDEAFVRAWQQADSLAAAAEKMNMSPRAASLKAFKMRKAGVPLKMFQQGKTKIAVEKLTEIARQCEKQHVK